MSQQSFINNKLISFSYNDFTEEAPNIILKKITTDLSTQPITTTVTTLDTNILFYEMVSNETLVILKLQNSQSELINQVDVILHNILTGENEFLEFSTSTVHNFGTGLFNIYCSHYQNNTLYFFAAKGQFNAVYFYKVDLLNNEISSVYIPYLVPDLVPTKVLHVKNNILKVNMLREFVNASPRIINVNLENLSILNESVNYKVESGLLKLTNTTDTIYAGMAEVTSPPSVTTRSTKLSTFDSDFNLINSSTNIITNWHSYNTSIVGINNLAFQQSDSSFFTVSSAIPTTQSWVPLSSYFLYPSLSQSYYGLLIKKFTFQGDLIWSDVVFSEQQINSYSPFSINCIGQDSLAIAVSVTSEFSPESASVKTLLYKPQAVNIISLDKSLSAIKLFPNPCSNILSVSLNTKSNNLSYKILDLTGKEITKGEINNRNQININTENFTTGLYILRIIDKSSIYSEKFFKK